MRCERCNHNRVVAETTAAWIEDQRRRYHGGVGGYEEHYRQARINSVNHLAECVDHALKAGRPADSEMLASVSQGIARRWFQARKLPFALWLRGQAAGSPYEAEAEQLISERDRLREALEFYADVDTWDAAGVAREAQLDGSAERDFGSVARAALGVSDDGRPNTNVSEGDNSD